jgi:hypothetical protein
MQGRSFWLQRSWCWSKSDSVRWPIFNSSHVFGFSPFLTLIYKGFKTVQRRYSANFEVAFLLFWTFTKRRAAKDSTWMEDRVNFQQTTGRSTSKRQRFVSRPKLLWSFIFKLSEEQKNNSVYFMIWMPSWATN